MRTFFKTVKIGFVIVQHVAESDLKRPQVQAKQVDMKNRANGEQSYSRMACLRPVNTETCEYGEASQ